MVLKQILWYLHAGLFVGALLDANVVFTLLFYLNFACVLQLRIMNNLHQASIIERSDTFFVLP